jgi:GMP synthase-like glutamine amidotransferase
VIGICLGSQLIAAALGAKVYTNIEPEMGFWPVNFSGLAQKDKVFSHFPTELEVLHVHFDTFTLPAGAINMASSIITTCQAFRFGKNVFAFQFHFEVSPQNIASFITEISTELVTGKYTQSADQMLRQTDCCCKNNIIFENVLNEIHVLTQQYM